MDVETQMETETQETETEPPPPSRLKMRHFITLLLAETAIFLVAVPLLVVPYQQGLQRRLLDIQDERQHTEGIVADLRKRVANLSHLLEVSASDISEAKAMEAENREIRSRLHMNLGEVNFHPYETVTGSHGHWLPPKYGHVKEKTIWAYWYNPKTCPSYLQCVLPPQVQLCVETIEKNKGSFDFKIMHRDEVDQYVNRFELPFKWDVMPPALQKDSLMNALLARYGGVSMDISTVLLRPIDDYWDEMVAKGATFRGYVYRLNGAPWRHSEMAAVWFLMTRREGIFSTAVRNQVIAMGDSADPHVFSFWYNAFGDQTLSPILQMYRYDLPKCINDKSVINGKHQDGRYMCPEHEQKPWWTGISGPPKNDTVIMVSDPREGPQLPFACLNMETWSVSSTKGPPHAGTPPGHWVKTPGAPLHGVSCDTMKDCWEKYFIAPFHEKPPPGQAHKLSFIKLFNLGGAPLKAMTREQILAAKDSWFYHWLKIAGLPY